MPFGVIGVLLIILLILTAIFGLLAYLFARYHSKVIVSEEGIILRVCLPCGGKLIQNFNNHKSSSGSGNS